MKNIFRIVTIIAFIMIGMTSITKAQTRMDFWVKITDSCSGTWSGDYCIHCYVTGGSGQYCTHTQCGLAANRWIEIKYSCTIDPIVTDPDYCIYVTAYRDQNPPTCSGSSYLCVLYYGQLEDGSQYLNPILH